MAPAQLLHNGVGVVELLAQHNGVVALRPVVRVVLAFGFVFVLLFVHPVFSQILNISQLSIGLRQDLLIQQQHLQHSLAWMQVQPNPKMEAELKLQNKDEIIEQIRSSNNPGESGIEGSSQNQNKKALEIISKYPEPLELRKRLIGVAFIAVQAGLVVAYGLIGSYYKQGLPNTSRYYEVIYVVLTGFFAIVGFGLVLSVYRWGTWLGLASAIFVFAFCAQLGPFLQAIGYSLFLRPYTQPDYTYIYSSSTSAISPFLNHYIQGAQLKIVLSSFSYQLSFLSCISLLTLMTAVVGRLTIEQLFKVTFLFQIFWYLNFFVLAMLCVVREGAVKVPGVFDGFGASYVYLFAACFGVLFTILTNNHILPADHIRNILNGFSAVFSAIGTAFIFATFVFTSNYLIAHNNFGSNFQNFAILFALCGSVVGTYSGSMLANRGQMGFKEALVGTITGGVTVGAAAPYVSNVGIIIMVGSVGGFISGLLMSPIERRINKNYIYDALGLFVPFLACSLFGSLVVPCAVLAWCHFHSIANEAIQTGYSNGSWVGFDKGQIAYQLVYAGVSAGIGLAGGAITGLSCRWGSDTFGIGANARIFINSFGLYSPLRSTYIQKQSDHRRSNNNSDGAMMPNEEQ